jgi:hypothetical protein
MDLRKASHMWDRMIFTRTAAFLALLLSAQPALADDEVALFDGQGKATAYVVVEDDMTIYLWRGKPVAYLDADSSGGFNVYGFNGKHLGWFLRGTIWDHVGGASCAVKEALRGTQPEPLKSLKELKPLKSLKELAPLRPLLANSFGDTPCRFLLGSGGE